MDDHIYQCDQMLKLKVAQFFHICQKRLHWSFKLKSSIFKIAPNVIKYLGYLLKKICSQNLSKIAHPGHTGIYLDIYADMKNFELEQHILICWWMIHSHRIYLDIIYLNRHEILWTLATHFWNRCFWRRNPKPFLCLLTN